MTSRATWHALDRLARPLKGWHRAGWLGLALGLAALVLGGAAWLARLGWFDAPYWVLAAWAAALVGVSVLGWLALRRDGELYPRSLARRLEEIGAWRRGSLTALLEAPAAGTSDPLLAAADETGATELRERGRAAVAPLEGRVRRHATTGGVCLALGLITFATAGPVGGPAAALWHPRRAWEATVAPVRLRALEESVDRDSYAGLVVEAPGREEATLWLRTPGESWHPQIIELDSLGRARRAVGPLAGDLFAHATSGGRSSDTVVVRVRLPAFLSNLTVTARYPRYLGMTDEPLPTTGDSIILPAGTRLETEGEATASLRSAAWIVGGQRIALEVSDRRFSGRFTPRTGVHRLALATAGGAPLAGATVVLPVRIVADSAPTVEIPVPGTDTLAPLELRVPLVLDVRDDHGLTGVRIESRRISRLGLADSARREVVPLPGGRPDRAILAFTLDLTRRGLLPGDTVRYRAAAVDNSPAGQVGYSREFVLRLPTMSEVRAAQREATGAIASRLDSLAAASRRIERQTQDLAREQRPAEAGSGNDESLSYDDAKRAEAVAASQQELMQEAEELQQAVEALKEAALAAGQTDSAWLRQLDQIREQVERALSPELRERLAELQAALENLDAERTKEALERLAAAQREVREMLERSRELFRRAAIEGDLATLEDEARDLAQDQAQWTERVTSADSAAAAATERRLAARADSLAKALEQVAGELTQDGRQEQLEALGQQARQAGGQMQQAGQSAQRGQRRKAEEQGREASKSLQRLDQQIGQARQNLAAQWREEVMQALDRALAETSRLAERELALQESFERGDALAEARSQQAAVEEGVQQLLEQLQTASGKNALVPPQLGTALAEAKQHMQEAREAVSSAATNSRRAADRAGEAVDALNAAAYQLLRARSNVSGSASGSGFAEAMERMSELAQQQGGLSEQGARLLPMMGRGAVAQQLQRLAAQQRALAQQLERLRAQGNAPSGTAALAREAEQLARRLEAGRLDRRTVERQERLFRRMLDAGRTLQGNERDEQKERESRTATGDNVRLPPALRAELLDESGRTRMPSWEELQHLSPEERRLVVDYFRELQEAATAAEPEE